MSQNIRPSVTAKTDRLPSLRPPRDVNLIGNQPTTSSSTRPKFMPNLALAGKRQTPNVAEDQANKSAKRDNRGRGHGKDKRRKNEPEIIQSKGIFSDGFNEGAGGSKSGSSLSLSGAGGGESGGGSSNIFSGRRERKVESSVDANPTLKSDASETDEAALSALLKDNFISDLPEGSVRPVVLPLKSEKCDLSSVKQERSLKQESSSSSTLAKDIFSNNNLNSEGTFIFVQLPSVLPAMLDTNNDLSSNETKITIKSEDGCDIQETPRVDIQTKSYYASLIDNFTLIPASDVPVKKEENVAKKYDKGLYGLAQGLIGKLQILKSGQIRLKLVTKNEEQPIYFDVSVTTSNFAQELISIQCDNPELNEGSLNVISDKILHKMIVMPNIDNIMSGIKR